MINRVILIVMDSVGVGQLPDADRFNDGGAHTLLHVYEHSGALDIPNLCALGIGKIVEGGCHTHEIIGCYGKMGEQSANRIPPAAIGSSPGWC
jgi:phosphopentomutase